MVSVLSPRLMMICLTSQMVIVPRIKELVMIRMAKMTRLYTGISWTFRMRGTSKTYG